MEKILIKLFVPAVNKSFDLFVPLELEIGELTKIIVRGVDYLCDKSYIPSNEEMLNLKEPNTLLNPMYTLAQYGVKDGAELVLI